MWVWYDEDLMEIVSWEDDYNWGYWEESWEDYP